MAFCPPGADWHRFVQRISANWSDRIVFGEEKLRVRTGVWAQHFLAWNAKSEFSEWKHFKAFCCSIISL